MKKHTQQGFTLIEIVIVLVVIGILAAVLLPRLASVTDSANRAALESVASNITAATAVNYARYQTLKPAGGITSGTPTLDQWVEIAAAGHQSRIPGLFGETDWNALGSPFTLTAAGLTNCGMGTAGTTFPGAVMTCDFAIVGAVPSWVSDVKVEIILTGPQAN